MTEIKFEKVSDKKMDELFRGSVDFLGKSFCVMKVWDTIRFLFDVKLDPREIEKFLKKKKYIKKT